MEQSTHSPLTPADVADIQTARLTIERHLSGHDDADLPRAAAMLRAVLQRHGHATVTAIPDDADTAATEGGA